MIFAKLFLTFLKVGVFSIGGGYAAMPLIQSLVVDGYGWLTVSEFGDLVTIAEMTPGPILVNGATFVGMRVAGFGGAVVATLGSIFPSLVIVSILAVLYFKYKNLSFIQTVLKSIRPAVVALIACAGLTILINTVFGVGAIDIYESDMASAVLFVLAFIVIRRFKPSLILTVFSCGAVYMILEKFILKL